MRRLILTVTGFMLLELLVGCSSRPKPSTWGTSSDLPQDVWNGERGEATVKPLLEEIHRQALDRFSYQLDDDTYGRREYWGLPQEIDGALVDDCDGFAIYCRDRCREAGLKPRLVYCKNEDGDGHLVCEVAGWILDSARQWVTVRQHLPYQWISISGYDPGDDWRLILS